MTILTKLWLSLICAEIFTLAAAHSAAATPIYNGAAHFHLSEPVTAGKLKTDDYGIGFLPLGADPGLFADRRSFRDSAAILPEGESWYSQLYSGIFLIEEPTTLRDQPFPGFDKLDSVVLFTNAADQGKASGPISGKKSDCDFSVEGCAGVGGAADHKSDSGRGISKTTAVLLIVVGFIGLMRARGRPIP